MGALTIFIFFTIGVIASIVPRIMKHLKTWRFYVSAGISVFFGVVWFFIADEVPTEGIFLHWITFVLVSSFFFVILFMKYFLPFINETIVIVNTIAFWYLYLQHQFWPSSFLYIPFIGTAAAFAVSLTKWKLPSGIKFILYVWNLITLLSIMLLYVTSIGWDLLDIQGPAYAVAAQGLFLGMLWVTFLGNVVPLISLIPSKHDRGGARIKETFTAMVRKFTDEQISVQSVGIILVISALAFGLNFYFDIISDILLANFIAVALPVVMGVKQSKPVPHQVAGTKVKT